MCICIELLPWEKIIVTIPHVLGGEAIKWIIYDVEEKIPCYDEELERDNSPNILLQLYLWSLSFLYRKFWHRNVRNAIN